MLVAVASFAIVAMWQLIVRPLNEKAEDRRVLYDSVVSEVTQGHRDIEAANVDPAVLLELMRVRAEAFEEVFSELDGASDIYNRFDILAKRAGVSIKRLEPVRQETVMEIGSATVATNGFVVECEGTVDAIGSFIRLIQHENGISRLSAFRINPVQGLADEVPLVHASLRTEHATIKGLFDLVEVSP
jgi:hypothetical protein